MKEVLRIVGINLLILAVYSTIIYATLDLDENGALFTGSLRMLMPMFAHLGICTFLLISAFTDDRISGIKAYLLSIVMILLVGFSICAGADEFISTPPPTNKEVP
ncbi:MAG: hypothetical protein RLZZ519_691 [Bacteroidota bacterium]|jgi:hypothetical protein